MQIAMLESQQINDSYNNINAVVKLTFDNANSCMSIDNYKQRTILSYAYTNNIEQQIAETKQQ
jgi:hypothetical protein